MVLRALAMRIMLTEGLSQLHEAEEILKNAKMAWQEHIEIVRRECAAFQQQQTKIDSRLMTVTKSDTIDEAAKKFETSLEKLRKLDIAEGYMDLLFRADSLRFAFLVALNLESLTHPATVRKL